MLIATSLGLCGLSVSLGLSRLYCSFVLFYRKNERTNKQAANRCIEDALLFVTKSQNHKITGGGGV